MEANGKKQIGIRSARPEDAARLLEIYEYYVRHTAITFDCEVPSLEEFERRIQRALEKDPYLVIEENGLVQGYAYAGAFVGRAAYSHCREVSIYLDRYAAGRGYGRMLYEALEDALRKAGVLNLYACIGDPVVEDEYLTRNSEQFHRHMGFIKIGTFHRCGFKFGRWYNMIWMEKIIGSGKVDRSGSTDAGDTEQRLHMEETALTEEVLAELVLLSKDWEAENSCYGYRANDRSDIEGNRIFLAREKGRIIGYLFGHCFQSENMRSIMPEGSACFEVEELYIAPDRRSRGIGSALFEFAVDAVRNDAEYITLSTATKNWRAIFHFYLEELGMDFWSARLFKRISGKKAPGAEAENR